MQMSEREEQPTTWTMLNEREWVHTELGSVRLTEGRGWFFHNFLGEEDGPFPHMELAMAALERVWKGWGRRTETVWRHEWLGSIERLPDGRWIGRSLRWRESKPLRTSMAAVFLLHEWAKFNYKVSVASVVLTAVGFFGISFGPALARLGLVVSLMVAIVAGLVTFVTSFDKSDDLEEVSDAHVAAATGFIIFVIAAFADRVANFVAGYGWCLPVGVGKAVLIGGCAALLVGRALEWLTFSPTQSHRAPPADRAA